MASESQYLIESLEHRDDLPREDGSINNVDVVGAVDLQVGVDDSASALETAVSADLCGTDPVVGTASRRSLGKAGDVVFNRDASFGDLPGDGG